MKKINNALLSYLQDVEGKQDLPKLISESQSKKQNYFKQLTPVLAHIYEEVQRELALHDNNQNLIDHIDQQQMIHMIMLAASRIGIEINTFERDQILSFIEKDRKPFGILQPLVDDPDVSDIIVTAYGNIAVQQGRRNFNTDISFPNQELYEAFVERLLTKANSSYSTKKPVADGMLGSMARLQAVHKSIAEGGPYLTIRINRFSEVSLSDLQKNGLGPRVILEYLRRVVVAGNTLLIVGEVGTGKTTLARALASALPSDESLLVIEDTPEIKLTHPHVRYLRTREENIDGVGRISPSACIRASMRMAMNRIIFGEMRDSEAAEAFIDVCASGHPGLSTIHARSATEALSRLELFLGRAQKGVAISVIQQQISTAVQVVVYVNICKKTHKRRIFEVREIGPLADGVIRQKELFKYNTEADTPQWQIKSKVSYYRELLEQGADPIFLNRLNETIDLDFNIAFRESASA
jgi:pilus assembly protein CpaF